MINEKTEEKNHTFQFFSYQEESLNLQYRVLFCVSTVG